MAYATNTKVSVEKSRAEIESILIRYGATAFSYAMRNHPDDARAQIQFECNGKVVQFNLKLPSREQFRYTEARGTERHEEEINKHLEQGCRSRWRSLCLCINAKLDAGSRVWISRSIFQAGHVLPSSKLSAMACQSGWAVSSLRQWPNVRGQRTVIVSVVAEELL